MNELLCEFYDNFYISLVLSRHCLIDGLDNPDRKDKIAKELVFDSFVCGFKLALQLSTELRLYTVSADPKAMLTALDDLLGQFPHVLSAEHGTAEVRIKIGDREHDPVRI